MMPDLVAHEPVIRLIAFVAVFAAMAVWEVVAPRRAQRLARASRWPANIGIVIVNSVLVRLLFPLTAVGLAMLADSRGWGLLHLLAVPSWLAIPLAVITLDLIIYLQHVIFHAIPALWRLHRMHHADQELDVTSGARFHPGEIVLSMAVKLGTVVVLGAPALAVLVFEVLLNATAMFNHSNIRLPAEADAFVRLFVVTPDMHRVHHSVAVQETNSNFGFNLPWWDRLFGTYRAQPEAGHERMTIGLAEFRDPVEQRLDHMLTQPFRSAPHA